MILYRLTVPTSDGDVMFHLWTHDKIAVAPITGDFINPVLNGDVLFEVTSRLWEINEEPGLIVMAAAPLVEGERQIVPDGYLDELAKTGWERKS